MRVLALVVFVSGCRVLMGFGVLEAAAAAQHGCPVDRVHAREAAGPGARWVSVCGRRRLYAVRGDHFEDITGTVGGGAGGSSDEGSGGTFDTGADVVTREAWRGEDFERVRRLVDSDVRACVVGRTDELVVAVTMTTRGHATGASVSSAVTTEERTCIVAAFSGIRISGRARAPAMAELVWNFAPPPAPPPPLMPTGPTSETETAARAAIDERHVAIAACLGGPSALDVTVDTSGSVSIAARGALAGSAEEACARAVLGALSVTAPAAPLTIVHAVVP